MYIFWCTLELKRIFFKVTIFLFWPYCLAHSILVPPPGIEPRPMIVKVLSANLWTTREFPQKKKKILAMSLPNCKI